MATKINAVLHPPAALGKAASTTPIPEEAAMTVSAILMILLFIVVMGALNWYEFGRID